MIWRYYGSDDYELNEMMRLQQDYYWPEPEPKTPKPTALDLLKEGLEYRIGECRTKAAYQILKRLF